MFQIYSISKLLSSKGIEIDKQLHISGILKTVHLVVS